MPCSVELNVDPMPVDETGGRADDDDDWALNVRLRKSDARAFNSSSMSVDGKI